MFAFMITSSLRNVSQRRAKSNGLRRKARKTLSVRFNGIFEAAKDLGVTPQHLRKVLIGERRSDRLMAAVCARFPGLLAPVTKLGA